VRPLSDGLTQGVDKLGQARNLAAGSCFVDNTFAAAFVDARNGEFQGRLSGILVASGYGFANVLDQGAHGRTDVIIAGVAELVLLIALYRGLVVCHFNTPSGTRPMYDFDSARELIAGQNRPVK